MGSIDTTNTQELHQQYQPIGELLTVASGHYPEKQCYRAADWANGPVTAAADPTIADVVAALTDAANGPSTEVANGKVPMPQNVGIMPPYDEPSAGAELQPPWRWATKKADHSENTFNMRYVVVDCDLNVNKYLASKPKLEKVFQTIINKSLQEYGKMINPSPIEPPMPSRMSVHVQQ
ncbi:unnamed protein product [Alternaria alternata]